MTIRAVVFDIGGVLETKVNTGTIKKWEERLHLPAGELNNRLALSDWFLDATEGNLTEAEMVQQAGEAAGVDQTQIGEFMEDFWKRYLGEPNGELIAYLKGLRPRYKTALLSNAVPGARRREQERYHFEEVVDLIVYSYEEQIGKPDRRIFEIAAERLGVQLAEIVFLDDNEETVTEADAFGIQALLFRDTTQAIAAIQACLEVSSP